MDITNLFNKYAWESQTRFASVCENVISLIMLELVWCCN